MRSLGHRHLPRIEVAHTAVCTDRREVVRVRRETNVEHLFVVSDQRFDQLFIVDIPNRASCVDTASDDRLDAA